MLYGVYSLGGPGYTPECECNIPPRYLSVQALLFCHIFDTFGAHVIVSRQGQPKLATLMSFSSLLLTISGSLAKGNISCKGRDAVCSCMGAFFGRGRSNRVSSSYFEEGYEYISRDIRRRTMEERTFRVSPLRTPVGLGPNQT